MTPSSAVIQNYVICQLSLQALYGSDVRSFYVCVTRDVSLWMRHHGSLSVIEKVSVKAKGTIGSCMMVEPANCKNKR